MFDLNESHIGRILTLTEKHDDVPVDLADASLVVLSEQKDYREIATIDGDIYVYCDVRNNYLQNVFINQS